MSLIAVDFGNNNSQFDSLVREDENLFDECFHEFSGQSTDNSAYQFAILDVRTAAHAEPSLGHKNFVFFRTFYALFQVTGGLLHTSPALPALT